LQLWHLVGERLVWGLLPADPQSPPNHVCPKTWKVAQLNQCRECAEISLSFPSIVSPLFVWSHGTSRDGKALPIGELYNDAKQMTSSGRLSQNVINRIFTGSFGALYKCSTKTYLFDFIRFDAVLTNVFDTIQRPYELIDCHSPILRRTDQCRNESAERLNVQPRTARTKCYELI
jgi:hypothetical protein